MAQSRRDTRVIWHITKMSQFCKKGGETIWMFQVQSQDRCLQQTLDIDNNTINRFQSKAKTRVQQTFRARIENSFNIKEKERTKKPNPLF